MTTSQTKQKSQVEGALIDAAGRLARSGKYSFEDIVAKLSGAGSPDAEGVLHRPHIADALRQLCDAAQRRATNPPRRDAARDVPGQSD